MAFFQKRSTVENKIEAVPIKATVPESTGAGTSAEVLRNPRITEKATAHVGSGVYTFDVTNEATKRSIIRAISSLYNVTPRKIRVVTIPRKSRRNVRTGERSVTRGGKKAYVYLKKGDSITIV